MNYLKRFTFWPKLSLMELSYCQMINWRGYCLCCYISLHLIKTGSIYPMEVIFSVGKTCLYMISPSLEIVKKKIRRGGGRGELIFRCVPSWRQRNGSDDFQKKLPALEFWDVHMFTKPTGNSFQFSSDWPFGGRGEATLYLAFYWHVRGISSCTSAISHIFKYSQRRISKDTHLRGQCLGSDFFFYLTKDVSSPQLDP